MTGAEILVVKRKNVLWVKVRHDGQDTLEFFKGFKFSVPFAHFGSTYYQWRRGRWQMTNDLDQIQSDYQKNGFRFIRKGLKINDPVKFHKVLNEQAYKELHKKHRNNAFDCDYSSYQWLVDYDLKMIYQISWKHGEQVWNRKTQSWDYSYVHYAKSLKDVLKAEKEQEKKNKHLQPHKCDFECPSLKYFSRYYE